MDLPDHAFTEYQAPITIVGVGDSGLAVLNYLIREGLNGVTFLAVNTCRPSPNVTPPPAHILIGAAVTGGLGAGGDLRRCRKARTPFTANWPGRRPSC